MEKKLKNSYSCLDLPYNATEEEVVTRETALVKILKSKEHEENVSCEKEIDRIEKSSKYILDNIKNNGIPKEEFHRFEASKESVGAMFIIFVFVLVLCFFSFYIIL